MGCTSSTAATDDETRETLIVFAAASLRDVFEDLEERWSATHPGVELVGAFDGSNVLATQISEGAPADVFLSADAERPRQLAEAGHSAGQPIPLLRNAIAIVAPLERDAVQSVADLAKPGIRIVAAGRGVPITTYADLALTAISQTMVDPAAYLERVAANVVSREDNVRAALAKVELGEGDAAIVYRTDASSSEDVREIPLPPGIAISADYSAIQISDREAAAQFVAWLGGQDAATIFAEAGFEVLAP